MKLYITQKGRTLWIPVWNWRIWLSAIEFLRREGTPYKAGLKLRGRRVARGERP